MSTSSMHDDQVPDSGKLGPTSPSEARPADPTEIREVTRTYLEMPAVAQLVPAKPPAVPARLERIEPCSVETWRALYRQIGGPWHWHDRDAWAHDVLRAHLDRPDVRIYRVVAELGPEWTDAAGFLELERHADGAVEIAYIGLDPRILGQRLGGWLVAEAVTTAFTWGATRVWLHTCTLDAPAALPNYLARGFSVTRVETYRATIGTQA